MADLNKKLIDYGGLEHFRDSLLNDSGTTSNSTWSSTKINEELIEKQDTLIAGSGITISGNTISATGGGGGQPDLMVNVTYSQLKSMRDNKQLVPGQQYRITDYVTTTAQENTQSAGHQFDIIVVADSEDKLNENARAINHPNMISAFIYDDGDGGIGIYQRYPEGDDENGYAWCYNNTEIDGNTFEDNTVEIDWTNVDTSDIVYTDTETLTIGTTVTMGDVDVEVTDFSNSINLDYFANSKLESWELKYCLDNDTNRFSWAKVGSEGHNALMYNDGNSYICVRYPEGDSTGTNPSYPYAWAKVVDSQDKTYNEVSDWNNIITEYLYFTSSETPSIEDEDIVWDDGDEVPYALTDYSPNAGTVPSGKGVIYYMKDEWNNQVYFDFKNIKIYSESYDDYLYFFGMDDGDYSLNGDAENNIIDTRYRDENNNSILLPNNPLGMDVMYYDSKFPTINLRADATYSNDEKYTNISDVVIYNFSVSNVEDMGEAKVYLALTDNSGNMRHLQCYGLLSHQQFGDYQNHLLFTFNYFNVDATEYRTLYIIYDINDDYWLIEDK